MKKSWKVVLLVLFVLVLDQTLKIWVKTNVAYGSSGEIQIFGLDWALIHFVENPGMAFGLELGGNYGKLALSLFRLIAIGFLIYLIREFIQTGVRFAILFSFSLILAGAIGNIIDSAFYGMMFSASYQGSEIARIFPVEGGYAGFLHGKVVDMFYFPMFRGIWPEWMPFVGGKYYQFFQPVFNLADVAISVGVLNILLFQRSFFFKEMEERRQQNNTSTEEQSAAADLQIAPVDSTNNSTPSNNLNPLNEASKES